MISIRDIAKECGVSVSTVSKAMNGQPDISPQTREAICAKAAELGYQPNAAARALRTNRSYSLGVLFEDPQQSGLAHPFFCMIFESFRAAAESAGYDVTFISHNAGNSRSTYLEHCLRRSVDGVCIASADFFDPQIAELIRSKLPTVTIDHSFHNRTSILSDNVQGMETLVRHVHSLGHRELAFIHGDSTAVTENRLAGFYKACDELGIRIPAERIRQGAYHDSALCGEVTRELLALPKRPDCIFFPDDISALGGIAAIQRAGLKIPDDISVVGYDGVAMASLLTPSLTTYHQDTQALGELAAAQLVNLIERPRSTLTQNILVQGSLQIGESVRRK